MRKKLRGMIMAAFIALLPLTACGAADALEPGLKEYPEVEEREQYVYEIAETAVERMAEQEKVQPSLSDDFMQKYLGVSSFDAFREMVSDGIAVTNDNANMAQNEVALWSAIIADKQFNMYTTADIEAREAELNAIVGRIAKENKMSMSEFAASVDMTVKEMESFLHEQAEKYRSKEESSGSKLDNGTVGIPSDSAG